MIGEVIHYFRKIKVAVIKVKKDKLVIGDVIRFRGHSTDYKQKIQSMEVTHKPVESVSKGKEAAIKVKSKTRTGTKVFIIR